MILLFNNLFSLSWEVGIFLMWKVSYSCAEQLQNKTFNGKKWGKLCTSCIMNQFGVVDTNLKLKLRPEPRKCYSAWSCHKSYSECWVTLCFVTKRKWKFYFSRHLLKVLDVKESSYQPVFITISIWSFLMKMTQCVTISFLRWGEQPYIFSSV